MSRGSVAPLLPLGATERSPFYSADHEENQESVACPLCGAHDEQLVFVAPDTMFNQPGFYRNVACARCSMRYVNPRPTMAALSRHYPADYLCYSNFQEEHWLLKWAFARLQRDQTRRRIRQVERVIGRFAAGSRVLDVGCGRGDLLAFLKNERGCAVTGVDVNAGVVETVHRELGIAVRQGTLCETAWPEQSFEVVTMTEYLEHEPQPRPVLDEARRVLTPRGILAIEIPDISSPLGRLFGPNWWQVDAPRHLTFFSPVALTRLLEEVGFEVVSLRKHGLVMSLGYSLLQALGFRYFKSNKLIFLTISTLIGLLFWPLLLFTRDFMMVVARRRADVSGP
jgi:SAM-dependent methyltransferase